MYFCYNLEKEEGSLKTELKNCLSLYKIFYSCAFILILCAIHPIVYYEEIGSAAFLHGELPRTAISTRNLRERVGALCSNGRLSRDPIDLAITTS